eukprot:766600-Hanusia_phi.AAC.1
MEMMMKERSWWWSSGEVDFSTALDYTCVLDDMRESNSDLPKRKFYVTCAMAFVGRVTRSLVLSEGKPSSFSVLISMEENIIPFTFIHPQRNFIRTPSQTSLNSLQVIMSFGSLELIRARDAAEVISLQV